jgi:hypothetical protein
MYTYHMTKYMKKRIFWVGLFLMAFIFTAGVSQASAQVVAPEVSVSNIQYSIGGGTPRDTKIVGANVRININDMAPVQSEIMVMPGEGSSLISWKTNKASRSRLYYDTQPLVVYEAIGHGYKPMVLSGMFIDDRSLTTTQTIELFHLTRNTTYYYFIESIDQNGNVTTSLPVMFTTR